MASRMSPGVTMPSKWPYSSNTSAMCTTEPRIAFSTSRALERSITTGACLTMARHVERLAANSASSRSLRTMTPTIESVPPSCTGSTEWRISAQLYDHSSCVAIAEVHISTSSRGVIRPRAERSARRMTPRDHVALFAFQHAGALGLGDDGLHLFVGDPFLGCRRPARSRRSTSLPEMSSTQTIGAPIEAMNAISGATRAATPFGIAQRDLLGHQFADDQRQVGDDDHHDADAQRHGEGGVDAGAHERPGQAGRPAWRPRRRRTARRQA